MSQVFFCILDYLGGDGTCYSEIIAKFHGFPGKEAVIAKIRKSPEVVMETVYRFADPEEIVETFEERVIDSLECNPENGCNCVEYTLAVVPQENPSCNRTPVYSMMTTVLYE